MCIRDSLAKPVGGAADIVITPLVGMIMLVILSLIHISEGVPRMTERMDDRALRLKTLGNAVCPPQAYPIFRSIAMIANGTCGDLCP